jgi:hypothetical protein
MTDEELLEVIGERNRNRDKIDDLIRAMRGVLACFRSRTESSTCSEDHHPSCQQYLASILKRVQGDK